MKKTFIYKASNAALRVFTVFGASAFLLTVLALCGVPRGWQIGVCSVLPGCVIIQGLVAIAGHERRKMEQAFIAHHAGDFNVIESCEDDMKSYIETSDGLRLIFRDGEYVGWYVSGEEGGGKDGDL